MKTFKRDPALVEQEQKLLSLSETLQDKLEKAIRKFKIEYSSQLAGVSKATFRDFVVLDALENLTIDVRDFTTTF